MRRSLLVALALLAACPSAGCSGGTAKVTVPSNGVRVADFAFSPGTLAVHAGDTVTWVFDQPDAPHNVYGISGPAHFDSGAPQGKGTYRYTFTEAGTYGYVCQVHPSMHGSVVVEP